MTLYEFLSKASPNVIVSIWVGGDIKIDDEQVCDIRVPFSMLSHEVEEFFTSISNREDGWTGCKIGIVLKEGYRV